ncbi:UNKNOWN [Stylonychia lemnae]|uniref:Uncharacterized protein n=1 Tax=Stylonychia lemnae TaxID=5949 RepID=A0A078AG79_STYLE|nr:UNKNOWN [Stylonychia lemnae]|eukprot:CDW81234.1 UNKNOWN [Stylonychia lemnae]
MASKHKNQEQKQRGIYALTEISISDSDYTDDDPNNINLLKNLQDDSLTIATDYERYRNDQQEVYKYFNRIMYKIRRRKTAFENLQNQLVVNNIFKTQVYVFQDLYRKAKERDMTQELSDAINNHKEMKLKARVTRFDVENYTAVLQRQKGDVALMKEKCEEYDQIFKQYDDTMRKYEIINEVTQKEMMDIQNRLEQSKKILAKRLIDNQKKLEARQFQFSRIEKSIMEQDEIKKQVHKDTLKFERDLFIKKEHDIIQKRQEEVLNHINDFVNNDMSKIEKRYHYLFEKLGTKNIDELKDKIINQVIPFDIHKQSLENEMRDKLQNIGVLQGQKWSLLEELEIAKQEYEKDYKEQERFQLIKIKETEHTLIENQKQQEFFKEKIEINSKLQERSSQKQVQWIKVGHEVVGIKFEETYHKLVEKQR